MTFFEQFQSLGLFTSIRESTTLYAVLLWLHVLSLMAWGGMMLVTDLRWLRLGTPGDAAEGLKGVKRSSFLIAALTGLLLFGAKAPENAANPWFWAKMGLILALAANYWMFRRNPSSGKALAGGISLVLWMGAVLISRGPATVKDLMHSMADPNANILFESVQIISDEQGIRQEGPETDQDWQQLSNSAAVLIDVASILKDPTRRPARPRDRSSVPGIENDGGEIKALVDAHPDDFVRRAEKLTEAATFAKQALDTKNIDQLWESLDRIDRACEGCHVTYWYPNDARAVAAAREAGIIE